MWTELFERLSLIVATAALTLSLACALGGAIPVQSASPEQSADPSITTSQSAENANISIGIGNTEKPLNDNP